MVIEMTELLIMAGTGLGVFLFGYGLGLTKRPKGYIDYVRGVKDPTIKTVQVEKRVEVKVHIDQTLEVLSETDRKIEKSLRQRIDQLLYWFNHHPNDARCHTWMDEVRQLQVEADAIRLGAMKKVLAQTNAPKKEADTSEVS